jgi:hypothetical protein
VQTPGTPPDFASDDKEEKDLARAMMKITQDLNARLPMDFGKPANELTRVGCITCHRGRARAEAARRDPREDVRGERLPRGVGAVRRPEEEVLRRAGV